MKLTTYHAFANNGEQDALFMASKSVAISFYGTTSSSEPVLCVWARWWDPDVLCAGPKFEMTNESGSYFDWSADLTLDEFRDMHTAFRAQTTSGLYALPGWQEVIQPKIQAIDGVISGGLGATSRFDLQVSEWESGL
jgi:hypothetical protein